MTGRINAGWALALLLAAGNSAYAQSVPGDKPAQPLPQPAPLFMPLAPAPVAPPPAVAATEELRVVVRQFEFKGNSVFESSVLAGAVSAFLNRPLKLAELYEAADKVTAYYQSRGYTLTATMVPDQNVSSGTVVLEVLEGRIGGIRFDGTGHYSEQRLRALLAPIGRGTIYQSRLLEDALARLNALPGLHVRAILEPGADYGLSYLVIQGSSRSVEAQISANNYGRETLGELQTGVSLSATNLLGWADRTQLTAMGSSGGRLQYGYVQTGAGLGYSGLRLNLAYGDARYELGGAFSGLEGENRDARAGLEWQLQQSRTSQFSLSLGGRRNQSDTSFEGTPLPIGETISVAELAMDYSHSSAGGSAARLAASASSNFRHGDISDREKQRLRLELDLQLQQNLAPAWQSYQRLDLVGSPDPLANAMQFALGGPNSVRGYPSAEVRGDQGAFATMGLRRWMPGGPRVRWSLRAFVDGGYARRLDQPPGVTDHDTLGSGGLGADLWLRLGPVVASAHVDGSMPFETRVVSDGRDDGRVFASLALSY